MKRAIREMTNKSSLFFYLIGKTMGDSNPERVLPLRKQSGGLFSGKSGAEAMLQAMRNLFRRPLKRAIREMTNKSSLFFYLIGKTMGDSNPERVLPLRKQSGGLFSGKSGAEAMLQAMRNLFRRPLKRAIREKTIRFSLFFCCNYYLISV